jgi:phosphohistidine phosphatase
MKTIQLCFFRHGIAIERDDPSVTSDAERPLTDDGERKTRTAAEGLARLGAGYDKILTSPWLRARQTAAILAEVLGLPAPQVLPQLAGDRAPTELVEALSGSRGKLMLLVGHEPLLSATVVHLLGGDWSLDLKKAGACSIEVDALPPRKSATLLWHLTSRQLRLMAKGSSK